MQTELTNEEMLRYSRHLILPEVGVPGQEKLKAARVLLVGAGGLGSPTALYLAASGVGVLGIVDFDDVDLTNLHRQVIHGTSDVGRSKLDSAADAIQDVNPNVHVVKHRAMLTSENALEIIREYDYVVDGTDNFPSRYLVNDACVLLGKTNVYGSIYRFEGQATVFCAPGGPCYRCLYPEPPPPGMVPSCAEAGVLGVLPGIVGLIQATETVKLILGAGEPLVGRLLLYEALGMRFREVRIRRDPDCPVCGEHPTITKLIDYERFCGLPGRDETIDAQTLQGMIERHEPFTLVDVREPDEYEVNRIEGSKLIPLGELPDRLDELDRTKQTVVYCQAGIRGAKAHAILRDAGFENVLNLRGGIGEWERDVS
ncbi:UBA/THIF-type NAD/FAD binding protein [Fimbriimonas ginsengisoli Gsoil 348]|uniref:UBA/THIF-type NAD/FAD binding protein n=2 Tax=Fimbriimonas ginsengisoli TaxID=1005039 RepID=A0A068NN42_FIMGI|nr:molybdopterin-synthase adenylyltransferase MoeB [Fimbriimonas ginsengisoli]AIE84881.1 UBA/THIF-type NAD/FAD binding protein [Fimbriimonas ginsengisoli Gsoil 348]